MSEPSQTYTLLGMLCDISCLAAAPRAQPCKGKAARFLILFQPPANGGSQQHRCGQAACCQAARLRGTGCELIVWLTAQVPTGELGGFQKDFSSSKQKTFSKCL